MAIGQGDYVMPVINGIFIRFLDSDEMDELPYGVLLHWLEHLNRRQREYAAEINQRARNMLNHHQHLNRWLTEERRDDILARIYALQYANNRIIQETCCRFCERTYIGPCNLSRMEMDELMIQLEIHYSVEHPEGWRLMHENLHSNMLPYL